MQPFKIVCLLFALVLAGPRAAHADGPETERVRTFVGKPAEVLVADEDVAAFNIAAGMRTERVALDQEAERPIAAALRISVDRAHPQPYAVQIISSKSTKAVKKGDVIFATWWLRLGEGSEQDVGVAALRVLLIREPWSTIGENEVVFDRSWKRVIVTGTAEQDFAAGDLQFVVQIGHQRQVVDLAGCVVLNLGPKVDLTTLPRNKLSWPGMAADAPWRAEAQRRIERYRMADLSVKVVGSDGQPVAGAAVNVTQTRQAFGIGSFATAETLLADSRDGEKTRETFQRLFNRATTPIYWADWGWPRSKEQYFATAAWLTKHQMITRGHVMIYPNFTILPKAVVALKDKPDELRARLVEQVREISQATKPYRLREYDVTNELRDSVDVHSLLGREVVADWFAEARRQLPEARLALNENKILSNGGATEVNQDLYLDWYRLLKSKGQAPDIIGFQSHFGEAVTAPERVWAILDRFARETEAELQITEFDLSTLDEAGQGAYTRDFLTACFAHPRVTGFTMWGFWEGDHWMSRAALWRRDWSAKPNGAAVEELLTKTWWTNQAIQTGADGTATVKVFLGDHTVSVAVAGRTVTASTTLVKPSEEVSVTLRVP